MVPSLDVVIVMSHKNISFPLHDRTFFSATKLLSPGKTTPSRDHRSSSIVRNKDQFFLEDGTSLLHLGSRTMSSSNVTFFSTTIWRLEERRTLRYIVENWSEYLTRAQVYQALVQLGSPNSPNYRFYHSTRTYDGKPVLAGTKCVRVTDSTSTRERRMDK